MAFLKAGRNETRDLLFMRGWPDGFGERASERKREREREREVNVSASRLILRLKIIRGPTPVTTREESWGAYLRGTFDVSHRFFIHLESFTVPYMSPGNSTSIGSSFFFRTFYLISIHERNIRPRMRGGDMKTDFLGRGCRARMWRLSTIRISFNTLRVNGNFM